MPDSIEHCQVCHTPLQINERYRLVQRLDNPSRGSQIEVWRAIDCGGNNKVLKVLTAPEPTLLKLFQREAAVLRQLQHPGIPRLELDFAFSASASSPVLPCLVLEYIEGDTLEQWVAQQGPISPDTAALWLKELAQILDYVHQQRLFHRDIKPSNILRRRDGHLALIDFGAVRQQTATYVSKLAAGRETTTIYSPGGYTPLEQILGRAVPQSDFFALGRTFVYLLTGLAPEDLETEAGTLVGWRDRVADLPPGLADLLDELMASQPEQRPPHAEAILQRLDRLTEAANSQATVPEAPVKPPLSRQPRLALLVGLGCLVSLPLLSPRLAIAINDWGQQQYATNQLASAQRLFTLASWLNPTFAQPHYNQGIVCEDNLEDYPCALQQYQAALMKGLPEANSEFARLSIANGNLSLALKTIEQGLKHTQYPAVKASLLTNRGWIWFKQERWPEAKQDLQAALQLNPQHPHAACLLAQILERQHQAIAALEYWKIVQKYGLETVSEQNQCLSLARQHLPQPAP